MGRKKDPALQEAQQQALKNHESKFMHTEPCSNGHRALRYSANCVCTQCAREYQKGWSKKNRQRINEQAKVYRRKNREHNREYMNEYMKKYRQTDQGRAYYEFLAKRHRIAREQGLDLADLST